MSSLFNDGGYFTDPVTGGRLFGGREWFPDVGLGGQVEDWLDGILLISVT